MVGRAQWAVALAVWAIAGWMPLSAQQTDAEFETRLDGVIRSACHGYMIDALPDLLSSARDWLDENSPFCREVRSLPEEQPLAPTIEAYDALDDRSISALRRYMSADNEIVVECGDWMCQHVRIEARDAGHPVGQAAYRRVAAYCDENYECIERWFDSWPRSLPAPQESTPSQTPMSLEQARTVSQENYIAIDLACQCSLEGWGCYVAPAGEASRIASDVESARRRTCITWHNEEMMAEEPTTAAQAQASAQGYAQALADVRQHDARALAHGAAMAGPGGRLRGATSTQSTPQSAQRGGAGDNSLSCYNPRAEVCVDYRRADSQDVARFRDQCVRGGNRVLPGGCDQSGPSCSMRSGARSQTTYMYATDPGLAQRACISNGGRFSR